MPDIEPTVWCEKFRPETLKDLIIDTHIKDRIQDIIDKGAKSLPNLIFSGDSGMGKSSLAKIIVKTLDLPYLYLNMSEERGIDVIRSKVITFASTMAVDDKIKIVIGEEVDGVSDGAGKAMKNLIDDVYKTTRFICTTNNPECVSAPIKSRLKEIYFAPVKEELILKRIVEILRAEKVKIPDDQKSNLAKLVKMYFPDFRNTINNLQFFCTSGTMHINFDELQTEDIFGKYVESLKSKKLSEIRNLVKNNRINYVGMVKKLFDSLLDSDSQYWKGVGEDKRANGLVLCGECMRDFNVVVDRETQFIGFSIDFMMKMGK
jgi:DNA polymerase III delta prime subunit